MESYHITSGENWEGIRRRGLDPYPIQACNVGAILRQYRDDDRGIWAWASIPDGVDLLGCVMDRVCHKHAARVVLLGLRHEPSELFDPSSPTTTWTFTHQGSMSHERNPKPWVYHERRPYRILLEPIPPGRITLLADWDLPGLLGSQIRKEPSWKRIARIASPAGSKAMACP